MRVPLIGYLEAYRETKNKNVVGRRVGYRGGGGRQGANTGAIGGAMVQIVGATVFLGSPKTLNSLKECIKIVQRGL